MGRTTEIEVFLIVLVFSKWPLTTHTLLQESSLAGMPLSDAEYKAFFRILTTRQVLHNVCLRRAIFGCYDPTIQALDRYENHGVIPNGWICSDFPDNTSFPGFCDFALYRCSMRKYFAKRVLCPDEMTQKPAIPQTNQEGSPEDIVVSATEMSSALPDNTPTTSTESRPEPLVATETVAKEISATLLQTTETAAEEISTTPLRTTKTAAEEISATPLPITKTVAVEISTTPLPTTKTAAVEISTTLLPTTETAAVETSTTLLPTTETFAEEISATLPPTTETAAIEISATPLPTMEEAAIEISATPLPNTTAKAPLLELLSSSAIEMATKLISKILGGFTAAKNPSSESATSEPLVEFTPASADVATPESFSELPTITTPTDEFSVELTSTAAIITESELNLATVAAPTEDTITALTEFSPELATAMEIFPESDSDITESFFDSATDTTTTASDTEPCVVDYPEPLSTSTNSISSTATTATSSTSILPLHAATMPTEVAAAATSATTTAAPWPLVPGFDDLLPFSPPQPNRTMHILILSYIGDKNLKSGDMAGISASPEAALGSGNILQQEAIQNPLPGNGLKDLFLRLHDKSVQQLMHKMQNGISEEQKSSSLQLLSALNSRSDFKNRLQR